MNHLLLGLFWVLYGILHSVLAAPSVKAWAGKRLGSSFKLYRVFYTLVAFILFGLIILYAINMDSLPVFIRTSPLLIAGIIFGGSGVVLMIICIQKYFLTLSGLRSLFEEDVSPQLITKGLHQFMRHPLYAGTFAFIWGLFLVIPLWSVLISNAVITIYTLIGIRLEEQKLVAQFGEDYKRYQQSVPGVIPRFRPIANNGEGHRHK